ncbi:MAG: penicillin-binding protein 1C [Synergistaceae bacterium]|jgi:penicillin-binding protein 1C|nr:penicillin-binding protein 1C [Synergistaceae bacterium]
MFAPFAPDGRGIEKSRQNPENRRKKNVFVTVTFSAMALLAAVSLVVFTQIPLSLEELEKWEDSPALYDAEGRLFHVRLSRISEWSLPIPLADMGKWLPRIAVGIEDRRFYRHPGVDPLALLRAVWQNVTSFRIVSGASTITSQVIRLSLSERMARQLLPRRGGGRRRGFAIKVREFVQALKLERLMSKEKILETYLNRAPFGGNIRGVQAASLIYFDKPASKLSPGEACLLVGMLKGPSLYRPDRHPEAAKKRRDFVIRLLEKRGVFSRDEARLAQLEDIPSRWTQPPWRAFHFAEMVLKGPESPRGFENTNRIVTTLNLEFQTKLEALLDQAAASLPEEITAAAGVVDNRTGGLVAWVGNARFGQGRRSQGRRSQGGRSQGGRSPWVDCGLAPRSPGSALKPFAYLAAFDKGLLTPGSLLADSPLAFSGRAPRNFDLTYRGAVSARVALSDSLNAPAVRVLRMAGQENVLRLMREMGLRLREPSSHYGDSLILGGCEVTVLQVLEAYTALANGGVHRRLSFLKEDMKEKKDMEEGTRLVSGAAAWMVSDVLDNKSRLSAFARETLGGAWHVAFKTGTSYGLRDAWTAAWTPDFTVAVWIGNPGGDPWPGLVGAEAAAPVALSVLRTFSPQSRWYDRPEGLVLREVCSLSGRPPTAACLSTRLDWAIEGVTQGIPCDIHVIRDGKSALLWPAELAARDSPPSEIKKRPDIVFSSPIAEATYYMAPLAKEQKIPLRVEGALDKVWWYLNGRYIGTSPPGETFFYAFPDGSHRVSAADGKGRTAATQLTVVSPGGRNQDPPPLE